MGYPFRLVLLVVGDTGSCYATCDLQLPFAPFPGLRVVLGAEEEGEELVEVTWEVGRQRFVAALRPWEDQPFPLADQLALLRAQGWQVDEATFRPRT